LDYITKPFQIEEVAARVETHLALRRLQKDLQETNDRMQRELDLAARVQASMMRRRLPEIPGWQLAVELMPAKLTCGDFFDAFRVPDGRIALLIADVVDKGVGAALYMSMSCTLLRTFIMEHPSHPEEVFQAVNNRILEDTSADQFVTVFLGILDLENGRMTCSNAGHPPPLLLRADGTTQTIQPHGPVLGILEDRAWGNQHLQLSKGDKLVIYTDGITEAQNERAELFGMDRLTEMVRTCVGKGAEDTRDLIDHAVQQFVDGADQSDDIALMVLSRGE
jgi:sigma-B regulation protein RsbU (phosphoserine phosphatase)